MQSIKNLFNNMFRVGIALLFFYEFAQAEILSSQPSTLSADTSVNSAAIRQPPYPGYGSYYAWGKAQNGWGYCYQWTNNGQVLNGGQPVADYLCEYSAPSYYNWGKAQNGWGYCFHYTPQGIPMNQGQPVANSTCESVSPSYYRWSQANNGYTYCFQYANGLVLNAGQPVNNYYCQ